MALSARLTGHYHMDGVPPEVCRLARSTLTGTPTAPPRPRWAPDSRDTHPRRRPHPLVPGGYFVLVPGFGCAPSLCCLAAGPSSGGWSSSLTAGPFLLTLLSVDGSWPSRSFCGTLSVLPTPRAGLPGMWLLLQAWLTGE